MNDSFLEDLELIPNNPKQSAAYPVDRNVTTRAVTSSPLQQLQLPGGKVDNSLQRRSGQGSINLGKDLRRTSDTRRTPETRKPIVKVKPPEKKEKPVETRLKPVENRVRIGTKELSPKEDAKIRVQDSRLKIEEAKLLLPRDRARRSGSCKENNLSTDTSTKENRPSDSSKDSTSNADCKDKNKKYDSTSRRSDAREKDPVALLNAIKELVSTYTKQESTKILRAMQELHVNSQATLIKNLVCQTDDILKEIFSTDQAQRMKALVQEKERLEHDVIYMKRRNEELLTKMEVLKQENLALKMKCDKVLN